MGIMADHFGHLTAHIFTLRDLVKEPAVTHSWLVSVAQCSFTRDVSLAMESSVWEFARSSCAVGATHQDTESALFQISEEEEQENDGTEESWKSVFVSEGWKTAHLEWSAY